MLWPVPKSYSQSLPKVGEPGSFWENRGDRFHCGVDIYAPERSPVYAVEDGLVIKLGLFTSPDMVDYWNHTYFILIHHCSGFIALYAEMDQSTLDNDDMIKKGQFLGRVGRVLNVKRISKDSPEYIQRLKKQNSSTMLHFECFKSFPCTIPHYIGGNTLTLKNTRPDFLLNPSNFIG